MDTKFTPGPWQKDIPADEQNGAHPDKIGYVVARFRLIAITSIKPYPAHLIAAAPELF